MGILGRIKSAYGNITSSRQLYALFVGGSESNSGETVNADTSMRLSAVHSCVQVLRESVAQTPLIVYKRLKDGGKERARDYPLYKILHDQPNSFQTSFEWMEMQVDCLCRRGNSYNVKVMGGGKVRELIPLHPDLVTPTLSPSYELTYKYEPVGAKEKTYRQEEILHFRMHAPDCITGRSPISYARETIGMGLALEKHGAKFFGRGARPSGLLSTERSVKEPEMNTVASSWGLAHGGEQQGGTAVLDGGWKWTPLTLTQVDAQYIEARKFQVTEIARIFRVPPHLIGDLERATFSNIEHQSIGFVVYTLVPWYRRIEQAIFRDLIPKADQGEYFAEFLEDSLLRGDSKSRAEMLHFGIVDGYINRNEAREVLNRNRAEGLDEFMYPQNMAPVSQITDGTGDPNANQNP